MAEGKKKCPRCAEAKTLDHFGANKRMKEGKQIHCRPCRAEIQRESRARNPEPSRRLDRERKRRLAGNPEWEEYRRQQRIKYWETTRAYNQRYYRENLDRERERGAEWRAANPDRYRDPERMAVHRARRRALIAGVPHEDYTLDQLLLRDEGRCGICGDPIMGPLEIDHTVPISRGGHDVPENVRLAHKICNRRKHARLDAELVA